MTPPLPAVPPDGTESPAAESGAQALKLLVSNAQAAVVIGKRGAQIRLLQTNSGARVKVASAGDCFPGTSDRVILITGSHSAVASAADMILTRLFTVRQRESLWLVRVDEHRDGAGPGA